MKKINYILFIIFFFSYSALASNKEINIIGNQNIDKEVILTIIDEYTTDINEQNINEIIKKLKSIKGIKDIKVAYDDKKVDIEIIENSKILNINFKGLERFTKIELDEIINFSEKLVFYDPITIQTFIDEVHQLYNSFGYNNLEITYKKISTERDNFVNVNFNINEGKISKINKIYFNGNNSFTKNELLKIIKSSERNFFKLFFKFNSNFKYYEIDNDSNKLINFYKENGYRKVSINYETEFIENRNQFNIYFFINENKRYYFNKFELNIDSSISKNIDNDALNNLFDKNKKNIEKFDFVYNNDFLFKVEEALSSFLFDQGSMFFEIKVLEKINDDEKIDIIYDIKKVKPVYANKIDIIGNTRTKDKVIRREVTFAEGDPVNKFMISRSYKNLQRLDLFRNININESLVDNEKKDILIEIEEKPTGQFNVGAAFGTLNGASLILGLNEKNIAGSGRDVKLQADTSDKKTTYQAEVIEPYIFNKKLNFIYGFNYSERDLSASSSYNLDNKEIKTGINYYFDDDLFHSIMFKYAIKEYQVTNSSTVEQSILDSQGTNTEISIINSITFDKLNAFIRPTDGYLYKFSNTISPPTNSTNGYIKNTFLHQKYLTYKKRNIFSIKSKVGNVISLQNSSILSDNKFGLGGNWLRGFDSLGAGPRNSRTSYVGGRNLIVSKIDYTRAINNDADSPIDLNLFVDAGKVWDNKTTPTNSNESIRSSYGIGLKFYTPVGPVGFSWAFPIQDESYDINRMFLFTIGNLN